MKRLSTVFRVSALALSLLTLESAAGAGTIVGHVRARSAADADSSDASGGSYGSRRYKFLEKVDYSALRDFVVYIDQVRAPTPPGQPLPHGTVTQRDGTFVPHILPVLVGTTVDWPNADDIFHNVFSMSESTPFDLGLYKHGDKAKSVVFNQTGRVEVFCSIHTKMNCIVLVLPNPWFARVGENGRYIISDVPAGTYKLRAWHERLPSKIKEITVPATGEVNVDFVLGLGAPGQD